VAFSSGSAIAQVDGGGHTVTDNADAVSGAATGSTRHRRGEETAQLSDTLNVNASQFNTDADVSLDLSQGTLIGNGVGTVSVNFSAGSKGISAMFATGTDAQAYFPNHAIDPGAPSTLTHTTHR
jgi:hypothetical protein